MAIGQTNRSWWRFGSRSDVGRCRRRADWPQLSRRARAGRKIGRAKARSRIRGRRDRIDWEFAARRSVRGGAAASLRNWLNQFGLCGNQRVASSHWPSLRAPIYVNWNRRRPSFAAGMRCETHAASNRNQRLRSVAARCRRPARNVGDTRTEGWRAAFYAGSAARDCSSQAERVERTHCAWPRSAAGTVLESGAAGIDRDALPLAVIGNANVLAVASSIAARDAFALADRQRERACGRQQQASLETRLL